MVRSVYVAAIVIPAILLVSCGLEPATGVPRVMSTVRTAATPHTGAAQTAAGATGAVDPAPSATPMAGLDAAAGAVIQASATATPASFMPLIDNFSCEPCAIDPGESATLRWDVTGAIWVTLDNRGVVAPGSSMVQPDQTTAYKLVAANENGRSEKTVTVEVRGLPVIHHFTCLPCQVRAGEAATLSWDLSGGTAAYLDGQGVTAPGTTEVFPDKTTTYRLEAVGERGSVERLVTVAVVEGGNPDAVTRALTQVGYRVRSVSYHPLARGGQAITVVMAAACASTQSCTQTLADQYFWGLKSLYDGYPGERLSAGVYDGIRYTTFLVVESASMQAYLRGELDGRELWRTGRWYVWDEWGGRWLYADGPVFSQKDFISKRFAR